MLIVNPYTGQTLDDAWYESIVRFNSTTIKIRCLIHLKEITPGVIDKVYKDPNTLLFEKATNPMAHAVDLIVNKQDFYARLFNNPVEEPQLVEDTVVRAELTPVDYEDIINQLKDINDNSKNKNTMNKTNNIIRLVNDIFSHYNYGRPLKITAITVKNKVNALDEDDFIRTVNAYEEIVYMPADQIERGLDNGHIYIDEETGDHTLDDGRIVRVGDTRGNRIRIARRNYRTIYTDGCYWPIKNSIGTLMNPINTPGYAIYEDDNKTVTKVFTKNYDTIGVSNMSPQEQLKAIIKHCKVKIKSITDSATIFGRQTVKKKMMLSDKNNIGYDIVEIIPNYKCGKDGVERDIVIIKGDLNYKFCLSDINIVFPFANTVLKGIIPVKDKTIKVGRKAKIINDKNLKIGKGEIVTIVNIKNNYHQSSRTANHVSVVTVSDKGGNMFKVWSNYLKVI